MDKITLINIGTEEEADAAYEKFVASTKQANHQYKLWMLLVVILWALLVFAAERLMQPGMLRNLIQIAFTGVAYIILHGLYVTIEPITPYFYPPTYIYHQLIKDHNIIDMVLHSRFGKYDLELVHEDAQHKVSFEFIYNFASEIRTDVNSYTVDLQNRMVYVPYEAQNTKISTPSL